MKKFVSILFRLLLAALIVFWTALSALAGSFAWRYGYKLDIPDVRRLASASSANSVCSPKSERTFVALASVPQIVRDAVLAAEEPDFFHRAPVTLVDFLKAAATHKRPGSTISETVVRCFISSSECCHGIDWHFANLVLLFWIEQAVSRNAIFELYINQVSFGRRAVGAGAAAANYFGKPLSELTVAEAAYLAALLRTPSLSRKAELGLDRRNSVVERMLAAGTISTEQAAAAKQEPLRLREGPAPI